MDALTRLLRAISDPTRRAILDRLLSGSRSVAELKKQFSMSRPAVSKHLGVLRDAGLVVSQRVGRQQMYELDLTPLARIREWLEPYRREGAIRDRPRPEARKAPASSRPDDWKCW
ncbi:MAG: metalloregulator ArsR/SmtB family transcription factor [Acidobacteriota bacterium]